MFNFDPGSPRSNRKKEVDPDLSKMEGMDKAERELFVMKRSQENRYNRHRDLMRIYDTRGYREHFVHV